MYSKQRIEILSDGIFAIVMTLLVLDVKVPVDVPSGHLWQALQMEGHLWASYLVTFVLAAYYWTIQHRLLNLIERMEPRSVSAENHLILAMWSCRMAKRTLSPSRNATARSRAFSAAT